MPASRSRTHEWRRSLEQLLERDGALEIAVARQDAAPATTPGGDLVWRVRVVGLTEQQLIVESPFALGRPLDIAPGTDLICAIAIGQNRWMFRSRTLGYAMPYGGNRSTTRGLRLEMPTNVERCSRRALRVDVADLRLPKAQMWPLLDPSSVLVAERANELAYAAARAGEPIPVCNDDLLPTVGPCFSATVMNIGGGGLGLMLDPNDASALARHRLFWFRFQLADGVGVPICAAGRVVHTHIDSTQSTYAGVSFEFTFNPSHQRTVADQIAHAIHFVQREQAGIKRAD
ncbi:MAG: hypothetical protein EXS10_03945 [Phycisphaerales bacterium]|nr:hypothetical protein [Phycisphaerales bacterium]